MTISRLPLDATTPHFAFSVELDGSRFIFGFDWNARDGAWYCSVSADDADSTEVVTAWRVCAPGRPLLRTRGALRPEGEVLFVDLEGTDVDPGRDDLGVRVIALYYDAESWAEAVAEAQA